MSRLGDQIVPAILECANCSLHATAGAALSETVASVSLSAVPRRFLLPGSFANGQADVRERAGGVADWTDLPCIQVGSNDAAFRWLSLLCGSKEQFSANSTQKDRREHCKTPRWRCWFGGSQPLPWRWKFDGRNNTSNTITQNKHAETKATFGCVLQALAQKQSRPYITAPVTFGKQNYIYYVNHILLLNTGAKRAISYPGITSVSAGGTYPPACIVGTSVSSQWNTSQAIAINWTSTANELNEIKFSPNKTNNTPWYILCAAVTPWKY